MEDFEFLGLDGLVAALGALGDLARSALGVGGEKDGGFRHGKLRGLKGAESDGRFRTLVSLGEKALGRRDYRWGHNIMVGWGTVNRGVQWGRRPGGGFLGLGRDGGKIATVRGLESGGGWGLGWVWGKGRAGALDWCGLGKF